ncbi:delta-type opioid receptor-like [Asterias amurensis]|uniref:delta-type opioid receptor-like n=1 Tax=Asterias amurensis TaxID=7602 RepID=UPI003AB56F74
MAYDNAVKALDTVIACSAILGNGLVIFVMTVRRKQFTSFTNRLILHQSVVDFVSGVTFLGLRVIKGPGSFVGAEVGDTFWGVLVCRLIESDYFIWGLNVTSSYNLVVISLERFLATCYPVKHRNYCSLFKIKVSMCAAWIIGFAYSTRVIAMRRVHQGMCVPVRFSAVYLILPPLLVEYMIPVTLMAFSYVNILLMLRRKLAGETNANQRGQGVLSKAKRNVLKTMLIAGTLFFVCWSPIMVVRFLIITTNIDYEAVFIACSGLVMCNMSVNPVVYCFKYEHFQVQLMHLIRSTFRRNRVQAGGETNSTPLSIDPNTAN